MPFFFITKPYGWILPVFSVVVCICQGFLQAFKMRPREYELKYNDIPSFWRYAELDDNDIVCATKDKWWVILLRVCVLLIPIAISVEMFLFLDGIWKITCWLPAVLFFLLILPFRDNTIYGYQLHFVDDKNDIEYFHLKEFMTRNNLKIKNVLPLFREERQSVYTKKRCDLLYSVKVFNTLVHPSSDGTNVSAEFESEFFLSFIL